MELTENHALASLRWRRLKVTLINIRMAPSTYEQPLFIMEAIIKGVSSQAGTDIPIFHMAGGKHTFKINKNSRIPLEIFFCRTDRKDVERWRAAMTAYLSDPETGRNYDVVSLGDIEERSLETIASECSAPPDQGELCLEFLTPFPFHGKGRSRYLLSKNAFIRAYEERFSNLFATKINYLPGDDDFSVLPYYWKYKEITHRGKSQGGIQYVNGCFGKLYLKGSWANFLPFLLLGAELHTGVKLSNGQGYYLLCKESPGVFRNDFGDEKKLLTTIREVEERYDNAALNLSMEGTFMQDNAKLAAELAGELRTGAYAPLPNIAFLIKKKSGAQRMVEQLHPRDLIVQEHILKLIADPFDRMFEEESIGFRKGISRQNNDHQAGQQTILRYFRRTHPKVLCIDGYGNPRRRQRHCGDKADELYHALPATVCAGYESVYQ